MGWQPVRPRHRPGAARVSAGQPSTRCFGRMHHCASELPAEHVCPGLDDLVGGEVLMHEGHGRGVNRDHQTGRGCGPAHLSPSLGNWSARRPASVVRPGSVREASLGRHKRLQPHGHLLPPAARLDAELVLADVCRSDHHCCAWSSLAVMRVNANPKIATRRRGPPPPERCVSDVVVPGRLRHRPRPLRPELPWIGTKLAAAPPRRPGTRRRVTPHANSNLDAQFSKIVGVLPRYRHGAVPPRLESASGSKGVWPAAHRERPCLPREPLTRNRNLNTK